MNTIKFYILLALCLGCFTQAAEAYIAKPSKLTPTITWEITDDGTLRIYGSGEMPDFLRADQKYWRQKKYFPAKIKKVEIGEGITKIGNHAFSPTTHLHTPFFSLVDVPITLPSTIKKIGVNALETLRLTDSRLPESLQVLTGEIFDMVSFPDDKIIVPQTVKTLANNCFFMSEVKVVEIEGNPDISPLSFHHFYPLTVIIHNPDIDLSYVPMDNGENKVTFVYPAGSVIPQAYENFPDRFIFMTENGVVAPKDNQNVNGYIARQLMDWEDYIASRSLPWIPSEEEAARDIERRIAQWQKRDEFESTAQYQARVNTKTRERKLSELTAEWNNKAKQAKQDYNDAVMRHRKEYEAKREKLRKEFYTDLAKKAIADYREDEYSLTAPYDPDNQTFLINSKRHGDILLPVPRTEAPAFKKNWQTIASSMDFAFIPDSETSVGLSRIIFTNNGKEYSYKGDAKTAYKVADTDYAFSPLEVTGLRFENVSLPEFSKPADTGKTVTAQQRQEPKKATPKPSDVDTNIPLVNTKRENTFAFLIANENYSRTDPVVFALNDGEIMMQYCIKTLGIPEKNVTLVTDATLNDMRYQVKRISDICEAYNGDASILVYYAGHGVPEEGSLNAYLLPVDGFAENVKTGYSLKELVDTLSELPAEKVTLMLDACFSGTGREGKSLYASRGVALRPKPISPKGNLVVFAASQGVESAQPLKDQSHGMFTYYLLKKLKSTGGKVTLGELADFITENVRKTSVVEGKVQTPSVNASLTNPDWRDVRF